MRSEWALRAIGIAVGTGQLENDFGEAIDGDDPVSPCIDAAAPCNSLSCEGAQGSCLGASDLSDSLVQVAHYRHLALRTIRVSLNGMPAVAQAKCAVWCIKQDNAPILAESFADVIDQVASFVDPVIDSSAADKRWDPNAARWA